jgi:hypothetical protein
MDENKAKKTSLHLLGSARLERFGTLIIIIIMQDCDRRAIHGWGNQGKTN